MRNWIILSAGLLSAGLTAVHIFAGGADVLDPIIGSDLSLTLKGYVRVLWHGVTTLLVLASAMLLLAGVVARSRPVLAGWVIVQYLALAGLFLAVNQAQAGQVPPMPQWAAFLLIAALAGFGLWRDKGTGS